MDNSTVTTQPADSSPHPTSIEFADRAAELPDEQAREALRTGKLPASQQPQPSESAPEAALPTEAKPAQESAPDPEVVMKRRTQERFDHILRERHEFEAKAARLEAELQALKANPPKPGGDDFPDLDAYEGDDGLKRWQKDVAKWNRREATRIAREELAGADASRRATAEKISAEYHAAQIEARIRDRLEKTKALSPEYAGLPDVNEFEKLGLTETDPRIGQIVGRTPGGQAVVEFADEENGIAVLNYLLKHPDEAREVGKLSKPRATVKLTEIADRITTKPQPKYPDVPPTRSIRGSAPPLDEDREEEEILASGDLAKYERFIRRKTA